MCFRRVGFGILKCDCEQMIVPSKATGERPRSRVGQITGSNIALQRRREVIGVAIIPAVSKQKRKNVSRRAPPEIKVLRHVDLFEDSHETLLLARFLDLMAGRYGKHLRLLAVVHIVAAEQRDGRSFRDENHIPARREPDKTYVRRGA